MTTVCLDCATTLHVDEATCVLVDPWGKPICEATCRAHVPDLRALSGRPTAPATRMPVRRTERGGLIPTPGGAGAVPAPTVPGKGRSGLRPPRRTATARGAALDLGHPAAPVAAALSGRRTEQRQPAGNPAPQHHKPGAQRRVPSIHPSHEGN